MRLMIDPKEREKRLEICESCEFNDKRRPKLSPVYLDVCLKCGCMIEAKARVWGSRCPIGKWDFEDALHVKLAQDILREKNENN